MNTQDGDNLNPTTNKGASNPVADPVVVFQEPAKQEAPSETVSVGNTVPKAEPVSLEEKKRLAMLAMEGDKGRSIRETREREQKDEQTKKQLKTEREGIEKKLEQIASKKEALEIRWVELSDKKTPLEKMLEPILKEESALEAEEQALEQEEHIATSPVAEHDIEQKRWALEDKRRLTEQKKWKIQEQVVKLKEMLDQNTSEYQKLLTEEDALVVRVKEIDKNLELYE